jgi:tetratricopeptide (TPR) repeat protein
MRFLDRFLGRSSSHAPSHPSESDSSGESGADFAELRLVMAVSPAVQGQFEDSPPEVLAAVILAKTSKNRKDLVERPEGIYVSKECLDRLRSYEVWLAAGGTLFVTRKRFEAQPDQPKEDPQRFLNEELPKARNLGRIDPRAYAIGLCVTFGLERDRLLMSEVPEEAKRLNDQAGEYHLTGQHQKAVDILSQVITMAPGYADAYSNMSAAYTGLGDCRKAIAFSQKAIGMNPRNGAYHSTLGLAYYKEDDLDSAIQAFKRSIELGDTKAKNYSVLGNCYLKKDMLDDAISAYKKALELEPSLTGARNNLRTAESLKRPPQ